VETSREIERLLKTKRAGAHFNAVPGINRASIHYGASDISQILAKCLLRGGKKFSNVRHLFKQCFEKVKACV